MRRFVLLSLASACLALAAARGGEPPLDVPLTIEETAGVPRTAEPVSTGVPLPRGLVEDAGALRLVGPDGNAVPAQFRVLARWWPVSKSIRWVLVRFLADAPYGGKAVYRLQLGEGKSLQPESPLKIDDAEDALTVDTGAARFRIAKKGFTLFDGVWVRLRDEEGKVTAEPRVATGSEGTGLVLTDSYGEKYYSALDPKAKLSIEESGPLHAVVRVDAQPVSKKGEDFFWFTARYHFWAGRDDVKLVLTMKNSPYENAVGAMAFEDLRVVTKLEGTDPARTVPEREEREKKRRAWLTKKAERDKQPKPEFPPMDFKPALHFNLLGDLGEPLHNGYAEAAESLRLYQDSSGGPYWRPHLARRGNITVFAGVTFRGYKVYRRDAGGEEKEIADGLRALGGAYLGDGRVGLTLGCRYFWEQFPKEVGVAGDGTAWVSLWPEGWSMRHTLRDREHKTHELYFRFRPGGDVATGRGIVPVPFARQTGKLRKYKAFHNGSADFLAFQHKLVATCPREWYGAKTRAWGEIGLPYIPPGPPRSKWVSMSAALYRGGGKNCLRIPSNTSPLNILIQHPSSNRDFLDAYADDILEMKGRFGWFNFNENLGRKGDNTWGPEWSMEHFLRFIQTLDRRAFNMGETQARHVADLRPFHAAGFRHTMDRKLLHWKQRQPGYREKHTKGRGVPWDWSAGGHPWRDFGGEHQEIDEPCELYYLTGDRVALDAIREFVETRLPAQIPATVGPDAKGGARRTTTKRAMLFLNGYQATGDERHLRAAEMELEKIMASMDPQTGHWGEQTWIIAMGGTALCKYYEITGQKNERVRAAILKMADDFVGNVASPEGLVPNKAGAERAKGPPQPNGSYEGPPYFTPLVLAEAYIITLDEKYLALPRANRAIQPPELAAADETRWWWGPYLWVASHKEEAKKLHAH